MRGRFVGHVNANKKIDRSTKGPASGRRHLLASPSATGRRLWIGGLHGLPDVRVLSHAIAVAADGDDMAVMGEPIDQAAATKSSPKISSIHRSPCWT